jgi:acyl carrier protein
MDPRAPPQLDFDANEVRTLIAKYLGIDAELVTDEVHFSNDFDLDSLGRLELLILIEEEFLGFEFSHTAYQIEVVGDLIRHIEITNKALIWRSSLCESNGRTMDAKYAKDLREKAATCLQLAQGLSWKNPSRFRLMDMAENFQKRATELEAQAEQQRQQSQPQE